MAKITTRTSGLKNRAEFDAAVNQCAELEVELRSLTASQDKELQIIREKYGPAIQAAENKRDALLHAACTYASMHQDEVLENGNRSGHSEKARFGFRLGQPTLVLLSKKFTWKAVVAAVKDKGEEFAQKYLTTPDPKPNKDRMKAELTDAELAEVGCRIEQTDAFFVEAKDNSEEETL